MQAAPKLGQPCDLLLLDCHTPDCDWLDLVESVRRLSTLAETAVMMLTYAAQRVDAERCRSLGIATCLPKPVSQAQLAAAIKLALPHRSERAISTTLLSHDLLVRPNAPLRILLAEDNLINQKVAAQLLERQHFSVTVVASGREVLQTLCHQTFDLILMGQIPTVALTAHAIAGDRERCLAAGMDGYVTKPIRMPDLLREINSLSAGGGALRTNMDEFVGSR